MLLESNLKFLVSLEADLLDRSIPIKVSKLEWHYSAMVHAYIESDRMQPKNSEEYIKRGHAAG